MHFITCTCITDTFSWPLVQERGRGVGGGTPILKGWGFFVATVQVEDIGPKIRAYNAPACQTRTRLRLRHAHEIRA